MWVQKGYFPIVNATVDARHLEHSLSQTFTISNYLKMLQKVWGTKEYWFILG